ncbi:MAG: hypothetical protein IPL15_10015 [Comamonadaceae bacterium]|uniref:hypothetical protein n=1 Tax=Candidatus Skiveiella danica TaxID=3386177 RepID=UPI00390AE6C1|nr:hypothetical protein [Comamonadaceae bacterium]
MLALRTVTYCTENEETPDGTAALRVALAAIPAGRFEVWVTHQVNITALTGEFVQMGEGLLVDAAGAVQGRSRFE